MATYPRNLSLQVNSDWNASSGKAQILNKPTIPTNTSQLTNDSNFVTQSQAYSQSPVQSVNGQTGNVTLSIPASQVSADWNSGSGISQVLNKPVLFSGSYIDLTNKPVLFSGNYTDLVGKPSLFDGTWTSLSGKPTIPAAQIQSDWNQANTSALDYIKNKPVIPVVNYPVLSVNTKTGTVVLTNADVGAAATVHTHIISDVTGLQTALNAKFATPAGTTSQYIRGDGSLATLPIIPTNVSSFTNDSGYLTGITNAQVTTALGFTPYNATNPSSYVNQSGARSAISLTTTGTSGASSYNSSTGVLNVPNYTPTPVQSSATRSLNTAFQVSSTRNALVTYSVQITVSATISGGQNGDIILEIASDSGFTTNVQTVAITGIGQTLGLALTLSTVQPTTGVVNGFIPIGYYARLRTVNNTGVPTFSYRAGQEVLL